MILRVAQILTTLALLVLVCGVGGFAANEVVEDALPGTPAFQVRRGKENLQIALTLNARARAAQQMAISGRRMNDFAARAGTAYEAQAFSELEAAIDAGIRAIAELPSDERIGPLQQLASWRDGERVLLDQTGFARDQGWLAAFDAKTAAIRQASQAGLDAPEYLRQIAAPLSAPVVMIIPPTPNGSLDSARRVPAPTAFKHSFPLNGAHAATACEKCHARGIYEGTPRDCLSCHRDIHTPSLGWQCGSCHTTTAWRPVKKK